MKDDPLNFFFIWLKAARLRTLTLSLSSILTGSALSLSHGFFDLRVFILTFLTMMCFQITSNFANDYGDGSNGVDGKDRVGPVRMLQSGLLSPILLRRGILIFFDGKNRGK